jgi:hypothetical protein
LNETTMMEAVAAVVICLLLGLGLLAYSVALWQRGRQSRRWPNVQGRMLTSQLHLVEWDEGAAIWPEIEYEYCVKQRTFRSQSVALGHLLSLILPGEAERLVAHYPAGAAVTVHYNPDNPQEAILEQGLGCGVFGMAVLSGLLVSLGIGLAILPRR